jgi:hypothetical protein
MENPLFMPMVHMVVLDAIFINKDYDRGFVYAIAHSRWWRFRKTMVWRHKLKKKKNTFKDFIACSTHRSKYFSSTFVCWRWICWWIIDGVILNMAPVIPWCDRSSSFCGRGHYNVRRNYSLTTGEYDEWNQMLKILFYEVVFSLW